MHVVFIIGLDSEEVENSGADFISPFIDDSDDDDDDDDDKGDRGDFKEKSQNIFDRLNPSNWFS